MNSLAQEIKVVNNRLDLVETRVSEFEDLALLLQGEVESLINRLQAHMTN